MTGSLISLKLIHLLFWASEFLLFVVFAPFPQLAKVSVCLGLKPNYMLLFQKNKEKKRQPIL
jgi:hypothetical protein